MTVKAACFMLLGTLCGYWYFVFLYHTNCRYMDSQMRAPIEQVEIHYGWFVDACLLPKMTTGKGHAGYVAMHWGDGFADSCRYITDVHGRKMYDKLRNEGGENLTCGTGTHYVSDCGTMKEMP